jgi:hypothetical protein
VAPCEDFRHVVTVEDFVLCCVTSQDVAFDSLKGTVFFVSAADYACLVSRGSAVGIATGYGLDDRGVRVRVQIGSRMFTSPYCPNRL